MSPPFSKMRYSTNPKYLDANTEVLAGDWCLLEAGKGCLARCVIPADQSLRLEIRAIQSSCRLFHTVNVGYHLEIVEIFK